MYVQGYLQGSENGQVVAIARMLRQLGPYYCFIILFNIYMCIIIYLFKRQLLSFSENELFIK